ncbi:MAG: hypothetical protein J6D42_02640 [Clostridia bacterium]|nr:hypothetical protein [Clostridia bacterium]
MDNNSKNQKGIERTVKSTVDNDTVNWKERLNSLDQEKQRHIAEKYYGGKMPWKK